MFEFNLALLFLFAFAIFNFIIIFLILVRKKIVYLKLISDNVNDIANGKLGLTIAIIIFQSIDIVPSEFLPDLLLYFVLSLSVLGSIFIFINRNRKNY
ncbi:hypothetical protein [Bacillus mycoides]|uniref:hypothetical protein n=1 Tax=Bacillus mycoides TaxID=1405 RepID=UPI0038B6AA21